ncbi:glycoside hydrolase superfamily [Chytridium lagenaria]|nr:glycoside hydrolase superfamily [Chytridium lagenaria]
MRLSLVASSLSLLLGAASAALFEPPNGRLYLSIWHENGNPSPTSPYLVKDYPRDVNGRLGRNAASYQYAQYLPVDLIPESGERNTGDLGSLERTETDAYFFLSIYPTDHPAPQVAGFDAITDRSVEELADQLYNITAADRSNRRVFLRLFPEMNGNWYNRWHGRPLQYVTQWRRVYDAVVRRGAKDRVAFVWAPNYGIGYPYGGGATTAPTGPAPNATEYAALDTNRDGVVDNGDDPFSPWYPGDEYVDWTGLSIYYKPFSRPGENNPPSASFDLFVTLEGRGGVNFYDVYSTRKNKPFMISESGAAYGLEFRPPNGGAAVPVTCCVSRLAVFQPFWREYVTNPQTMDRYPLMKMINLFEHYKVDDNYLRDFRITANTSMNGDDAVLSAFRADLDTVSDRYIWANRSVLTTTTVAVTTTSVSSSQTTTAGATAAPTTTTRSGAVQGSAGVGYALMAIALVGVFAF